MLCSASKRPSMALGDLSVSFSQPFSLACVPALSSALCAQPAGVKWPWVRLLGPTLFAITTRLTPGCLSAAHRTILDLPNELLEKILGFVKYDDTRLKVRLGYALDSIKTACY